MKTWISVRERIAPISFPIGVTLRYVFLGVMCGYGSKMIRRHHVLLWAVMPPFAFAERHVATIAASGKGEIENRESRIERSAFPPTPTHSHSLTPHTLTLAPINILDNDGFYTTASVSKHHHDIIIANNLSTESKWIPEHHQH
eukprot:scaffold248356_cov60-Cyclotella_meneghiniana.AAC.5